MSPPPNRRVLLGLAPWPTLLSLVRNAPHEWIVWGSLPLALTSRLRLMGAEVRHEALPQPLHSAVIPEWLYSKSNGVVVPALGHPLPTRWPIVRKLSTLGIPVFVASHGQMSLAPPPPRSDAYTWALETGKEQATPSSLPVWDFTCVRMDLLGDLLLAVPALTALAEEVSICLITREEWHDWMSELLPPRCTVQALRLVPWKPLPFDVAKTVVDLSPPGWRSPLTPAVARTIPAMTRMCLTHGHSLAEMTASALRVQPDWPTVGSRPSTVGVLVPCGSSSERWIPEADWVDAIERVSRIFDLRSWTILDPEKRLSSGFASRIPQAHRLLGYRQPHALLELLRNAAVVLGVSTALTHLAALCGTRAIIVEHPTTLPGVYRAPVPYVRYVRPTNPWWREDPSNDDVERALAEPNNTYGFLQNEWGESIERAASQLLLVRP